MQKRQLIKRVAANTGLAEALVSAVIEGQLCVIKETLAKDGEVTIRGFGCFSAKTRAERPRRNISKGTSIIVPAHKVPFFTPYNDLKDLVTKIKID